MKYFGLFLLFMLPFAGFAQKKMLTHDDYSVWKTIEHRSISNDGKWIAYDLTMKEEGDPEVFIYDKKGTKIFSYHRGSDPRFSNNSQYLLFTIHPVIKDVNNLERIKTKKDKMPSDTLGIYNLKKKELTKIPHLVDYKLPDKWDDFAFLRIKTKRDSTDTTQVEKKKRKENKENGYPLIVRQLPSATHDTLPYVTSYAIAEESRAMAFVTSGMDTTKTRGVFNYDFDAKAPVMLAEKGKYENLTWDKQGSQIAFLVDNDTTKARIRPFELYYGTPASPLNIIQAGQEGLPDDWILSEHYNIRYADNGSKLYFGTAPKPLLKDTLLLSKETVNVEIWNYQDAKLHTQQKVELDRDKKKSYASVIDLASGRITQLGGIDITITLGDEGNAAWALGLNRNPYYRESSWEGFPVKADAYVVDIASGDTAKIKSAIRGGISISPGSKYVYWYEVTDSAWFTYNVEKKQLFQITDSSMPFFNERHNTPSFPYAYGSMTWAENDEKILLYDRFDIWELDPENRMAPRNLTQTGRQTQTRFRYLKLNPEERFIKKNQSLLLSGFNEKNKHSGFYQLTYGKTGVTKLIDGPHRYRRVEKARDANQVIYSKESFTEYPDVLVSNLSFKSSVKVSDANPQQSDYNWGTSELVHWTSLDGEPLEGYIIKPQNFDPSKKYPMMVYFYERSSDGLYNHVIPEPNSTVINKTFYASREYIVFVPDIEYEIGYPGESAYNCVIPGVTHLINQGFVDAKRVGVQGQSWGGYQIAYLVTRTDIFACAESGAPVVNMTSAYGGIRWGSGLSRMFQYEHTQSRIGGTLWEYPLRYVENSPLFFADKINTPLLILHNDADTAVPWYQGIEFFVAMRRLNKPAWLVNYQGEPHNMRLYQNKKDFAIRMQQFFDHYLKDAPTPEWMTRGVPALEVGIRQGYDLKE